LKHWGVVMATEQTIYRVFAEMRVTFNDGEPTLDGLREMLEQWLREVNAEEVKPNLQQLEGDNDSEPFAHSGIFVRYEMEADDREIDKSDIIVNRN